MVKITLTDEQFKEVKDDLIKDLKFDVKGIVKDFIENEYDIYDEITNHIQEKLEDEFIHDNLDKIFSKVDKEQLSKVISNAIMNKLTGW